MAPVGHGVKSGYVDIQNDTPGKRISWNLDSLSAMTRDLLTLNMLRNCLSPQKRPRLLLHPSLPEWKA